MALRSFGHCWAVIRGALQPKHPCLWIPDGYPKLKLLPDHFDCTCGPDRLKQQQTDHVFSLCNCLAMCGFFWSPQNGDYSLQLISLSYPYLNQEINFYLKYYFTALSAKWSTTVLRLVTLQLTVSWLSESSIMSYVCRWAFNVIDMPSALRDGKSKPLVPCTVCGQHFVTWTLGFAPMMPTDIGR